MKKIICSDCGKICIPDGCGTGYGRTETGEIICYDCCGKRDKKILQSMKIGEKICLYLSKSKDNNWHIGNWPGTFQIRVSEPREGRHNMAGIRRDVWFGYFGKEFHGVCYGNNSEICHIQRIKG